MSAWWLLFALFLYIVCACLLVAEIFVPSGGIITVIALAAVAGGIAICFQYSVVVGWIGVVTAAVMIPAMLVFTYKIFPKTRFGKSVTLTPPDRKKGDAIADSEEINQLLGVTGEVITPLRPIGMCEINEKRIECMAEGGYIEKGKKVKVIKIDGTGITVRQIDTEG